MTTVSKTTNEPDEVHRVIDGEYRARTLQHLELWSELAQTMGQPGEPPAAFDAEVRNAMAHFARAGNPTTEDEWRHELHNAVWHFRNASSFILTEAREMALEGVLLLHKYSVVRGRAPEMSSSDDTLNRLWTRHIDLNTEIHGFGNRSSVPVDMTMQADQLDQQVALLGDMLELFATLRQQNPDRDIAEIRRIFEHEMPARPADASERMVPIHNTPAPTAETVWDLRRTGQVLFALCLLITIAIGSVAFFSAAPLSTLRAAIPAMIVAGFGACAIATAAGLVKRLT